MKRRERSSRPFLAGLVRGEVGGVLQLVEEALAALLLDVLADAVRDCGV